MDPRPTADLAAPSEPASRERMATPTDGDKAWHAGYRMGVEEALAQAKKSNASVTADQLRDLLPSALAAADPAGSDEDDWRGSEYVDRMAESIASQWLPVRVSKLANTRLDQYAIREAVVDALARVYNEGRYDTTGGLAATKPAPYLAVANVCDEQLDKSGTLLGLVRDRAAVLHAADPASSTK